MDNIRLPVEICEHIIDLIDYAYTFNESYIDWCRTSLVCSAWVPRSRFNLYHAVYLNTSNAGSLLLRTLEENSHLGSLVVKLSIWDGAKYIPLPRLARLLKNCVILDLEDVHWEHYPPHFTDTCLYPFSLLGIVNLSLKVERSTARALLRFVHSLAMLEELSIGGYDEFFHMVPIGAQRSQNGKPAALSNLKKLEIYGDAVNIFPPNYFGDAVVDLRLILDSLHQISAQLPQWIHNLHRLQTLDISFRSRNQDDTYDPPSMSKIRTLFSSLSSVPSGSALNSVSFALHPDYNPIGYHVDRSGLLDLLVGADMLKVLNGFPSLSQLRFELYENDEAYDAVWWKEEMVRRLPSHLHAVTIELDMGVDIRDLWLTKDEITTRRAQENTEHIATIDSVSDPSLSLPQLDSSVSYGGVRRKTLDAGGYTAYRVDFDLESENLGEIQFKEPSLPKHDSSVGYGGVRRKILDAGGYTAYRVDFDLESDNLGVTECDEPHLELPLSTDPALYIPTILKLHPIYPFHD